MNWRKEVVEVESRERLIELIASGDKLIAGVAALRGLGMSRQYECIQGLVVAQAAYRAQLAERFPDQSTCDT